MTVATDITEDIVLDQVIAKEPDAPGKWNVIFINDNQTPMDFVVEA